MSGKGKEEEIIIPELEEAAKNFVPNKRFWSERETAIITRYFSIVPLEQLKEHLPGRTITAIRHKASSLGLKQR